MKMFLFFLIVSCGKIVETPYSSNVSDINFNKKNKNIIESIENPKNEYRIAVLSDTHNHDDDFQDAVSHINRDNQIIFTVVTGDLTNVSLQREFERSYKILESLKEPFFVTAGNHDLLNNGEKIFKKIFGKSNFSINYGNEKFILFNNNNWESSNGFYFKQDWLESQIDSNKNNILFSHVPYNDKDRFDDKTINNFKDFISKNRIPLVFNGHNHSYNDTKNNTFARITVGSVVKRNYVIAIIKDGVISYEKINF